MRTNVLMAVTLNIHQCVVLDDCINAEPCQAHAHHVHISKG